MRDVLIILLLSTSYFLYLSSSFGLDTCLYCLAAMLVVASSCLFVTLHVFLYASAASLPSNSSAFASDHEREIIANQTSDHLIPSKSSVRNG